MPFRVPIRLGIKLLLFSELVLLVAVLALLVPVRFEMRKQVVEDMKRELSGIANTAALQLDGDLHRQVRVKGDESSPAFASLRETLRRARDANNLPTDNIYTFYRDGVNHVRFAVMTHDVPFIGDGYEMRPEMRPVFDRGVAATTDLYTDVNGTWLSAYAPIKDRAGAVTGLLEVDRPASIYFARYRTVTLITIAVGLVALAISSLLGWYLLEATVLKPMRAVRAGMVALGNHDFQHRVTLRTGDEFEALAATFNDISKNLDVARLIQRNFFPHTMPTPVSYRLSATSFPCDATGGDYFDAFDLGGGRTAVLVADVSGHGLGASLLMSACRSTVRALATTNLSPAALVRRIDMLLSEDLAEGRFITMIFGVLEADGTFIYCNAGHGPAILADAAGARQVEAHRAPIGVNFGFDPEEAHGNGNGNGNAAAAVDLDQSSIRLKPGDRILLASDGLTEAMNARRELLGIDVVTRIVADHSLACEAVVSRLCDVLHKHCDGPSRTDDVTILCIDRV